MKSSQIISLNTPACDEQLCPNNGSLFGNVIGLLLFGSLFLHSLFFKAHSEEYVERKRSECIVSSGIFDYRIKYIPFLGTIVSTACEPSSSSKEASR